VGRADTYSQPDAPDPILPDDLVLSLARAHLSVPDRVGAEGQRHSELLSSRCSSGPCPDRNC